LTCNMKGHKAVVSLMSQLHNDSFHNGQITKSRLCLVVLLGLETSYGMRKGGYRYIRGWIEEFQGIVCREREEGTTDCVFN
jgi:hypothetical protein